MYEIGFVFVCSFFVPHLSLFWCFGKAALRDYSISLVLSLIFSIHMIRHQIKRVAEHTQRDSQEYHCHGKIKKSLTVSLATGKNKKTISKCHLLKFLHCV